MILPSLFLAGCGSQADQTGGGPRPLLFVLGDSYATGFTHGADIAYPQAIGDTACLDVVVDGEDGTGYVNPGSRAAGQSTYPERVQKAVAAHADIVLIQGSDNDIRSAPAAITDAAERTYDEVRALLPNARLVAIGPVDVPALPVSQILPVRDALASATTARGVEFIDPVALGWLTDPGLFEPDRAHLTPQGHAEFAADIARMLSDNDRAGPCPTSSPVTSTR